MNKTDVYAEFEVDDNGFITSLGTFEGEPWYSPIVYGWYLDGSRGTPVASDIDDAGGELFFLSSEDRELLELSDNVYALLFEKDHYGFVWVTELTEAQALLALREEAA